MNTVPLWVTLLGFAAPLLALAGSSVAYVVKLFQDARQQHRDHLFTLMRIIDSKDPIAAKMAAVYELRQFPQHRDFIIRFCRAQRTNIAGDAAAILIAEMDKTREFFGDR